MSTFLMWNVLTGLGPTGPKMVLGVYGTHGPQGPTKSLHANKEDAYNVFDS